MKSLASGKSLLVGCMVLSFVVLLHADDAWKKREEARKRLTRARQAAAEYKTEKAADEAREALKNDPKLVDAHVIIAMHELRENNLQKAEASLRRALELDNYNAGAHCYLGYFHYMQGKLDDALDEFTFSTKLDATSPHAFAGLALVQFRQGMKEQAAKNYERALTYDKRLADPKFLASDKGPRWPAAIIKDAEALLPLVQKSSFPF